MRRRSIRYNAEELEEQLFLDLKNLARHLRENNPYMVQKTEEKCMKWREGLMSLKSWEPSYDLAWEDVRERHVLDESIFYGRKTPPQ